MSENEETNSSTLIGKPWTLDSNHSSFEEADKKRNSLKSDLQQVKVRRRPDGTFSVKVRSTKADDKKVKKKNKKSRKKKDSQDN